VSRSTLGAAGALALSKLCVAGKAPAGHRPALLWLRLRRTEQPYRRFVVCVASQRANAWDRSDILPNIIRRYGRLKIYVTRRATALNRY